MFVKIGIIGLILISGVAGSYFIIQNSFDNNSNLSNSDNDNLVDKFSQNLQKQEFEIGNPIKWVKNGDGNLLSDRIAMEGLKENLENKNENKNISNIGEAISEIKKAGSEIGKIIEEAKSSLLMATSSVSSQSISSTNDIEYLISEMKKIGVKQNMSDEKLLAAEKAIREVAATSTDLMAEFYKSANIKYTSAEGDGFFKKILTFFGILKISNAVSGLAFGGAVVSAIPCTCSPGVWYLGITPLAPTYATLLSYISGAQIYSNYVPTPHPAQNFLGFYLPYPNITCYMTSTPCNPMPDQGIISAEVGSSL